MIIIKLLDEKVLAGEQREHPEAPGEQFAGEDHALVLEEPAVPGAQPRVRPAARRCKEAYYGSSTSLSKRQSGIGFGSRSDFTKSTVVSPASPTYRAASQFDRLGQTYSFRVGREKSPDRDYLYHLRKARVPGPGAVTPASRSTRTSFARA